MPWLTGQDNCNHSLRPKYIQRLWHLSTGIRAVLLITLWMYGNWLSDCQRPLIYRHWTKCTLLKSFCSNFKRIHFHALLSAIITGKSFVIVLPSPQRQKNTLDWLQKVLHVMTSMNWLIQVKKMVLTSTLGYADGRNSSPRWYIYKYNIFWFINISMMHTFSIQSLIYCLLINWCIK